MIDRVEKRQGLTCLFVKIFSFCGVEVILLCSLNKPVELSTREGGEGFSWNRGRIQPGTTRPRTLNSLTFFGFFRCDLALPLCLDPLMVFPEAAVRVGQVLRGEGVSEGHTGR